MNPLKRVRMVLAAKLRADWSGVVEVPADTSEAELDALANQFFHTINMDEYVVDNEYWGKGECGFDNNVDAEEPLQYRAVRNEQGKLAFEKVPQSLWYVVHGQTFVP